MVALAKRTIWMMLAEATIPVEITSPACGSTLTNAEVTVVWNFSPGTQEAYRLTVYSDAAGTVLVYDSGLTVSSAMTATVPFGILSTGRTYYARVHVYLTDGTEGESDLCAWTMNFSPSVAVTGLEAEAIDCDPDSSTLPGIELTWSRVVPGGSESFVSYDIKRREPPGTTWVRIATIGDVTETRYVDYHAMPGTTYEYAVTWVAISGASTLVSLEQNPPPFETAEWDHLFIHDVSDPENYFVRYDQWRADEEVQQQVEYVLLAGRQEPTAQIGERQGRRYSVPSLTRPFEEPLGQRWVDLETLVTRQRTNGSILCARFGKAQEGVFCQISISRSHDHEQYDMAIEIVEVNYDEAV